MIEDLFIRFKVKREANPTPAEGVIDIYNLNQSNETRIRERAVRVLLEAGYGDTLETIFDGVIRRVERVRADRDRITRVHVGGRTAIGAPRRSTFLRTYEGDIAVRDIVRDGVATLGLELGDVSLIPEDAAETDFTYNGSTQLMLSERLRPLGIEWYEDSGVVRFSRFRTSSDDRTSGVVVSERTGMIGSPTVTDDGVRVAMLLDARMRLDTRIRIETQASVVDRGASADAVNERAQELLGGVWKVIEVLHAGDNRDGEYRTTVEGRPVQ